MYVIAQHIFGILVVLAEKNVLWNILKTCLLWLSLHF